MKSIASQQTSLIPSQIESVRRRLERWRRTRKHRAPIPDELWMSATELAGEYGLAKTARALRLDYYSLKDRLETSRRPILPEPGGQPAFVELVPQVTATISECTIELEAPSGARMRVHVKGSAIPNVAALSDGFWGARG